MSAISDRLIWAATRTLRPFVKRPLDMGVPFGALEARDFAETTKFFKPPGIKSFLALLEIELPPETLKELPSATIPVENWLPFHHDQPFVLEWCPSESDVQRLTHPTLVLEGDRTTPLLRDICRLLTEKLPNSRLTTMTGCDHLAPVLRPMLVAEKITEFIARTATRSN